RRRTRRRSRVARGRRRAPVRVGVAPRPRPTADGRTAMTTRDRTRSQLLVVAELTLAAVSVAAVLSLRRVFQNGSFLAPVLSTVLAAHLVAALLRRRKVPHVPALAGGFLIGVVVVTWLRLRSTAWFGVVPSSETLSLARAQVREAM